MRKICVKVPIPDPSFWAWPEMLIPPYWEVVVSMLFGAREINICRSFIYIHVDVIANNIWVSLSFFSLSFLNLFFKKN
jgi:hypothetical protein